MINFQYFSKSVGTALVGCVMTASLLGCQPTTEEAAPATEEMSHTNHDMHSEEEHAMHSAEEHADTMQDHENHDGHEGHTGHDHSGHDHTSNMDMQFNCQPEAAIGVSYHDESTPATAHLLIDGIEYDLAATEDSSMSTDSQTYTSDIGLDDTSGIVWQATGDSAILSRKTLNSQIAVADEEVLYNCQQASI